MRIHKQKGFTLIEMLVGVTIFTLSILVMIVILGGGLSETTHARNNMIAAYLAQEGAEQMRNLRDNYMLYQANGWNDFIARVQTECSEYCRYTVVSNQVGVNRIQFYNDSSCLPLAFNESTGAYTQSAGGGNSSFCRWVKFEPTDWSGTDESNPSATEMKVTSWVRWYKNNKPYDVYFSDFLTHWRPAQ